jgi:murein DD-endopeptidase MepM/ murein hydrolase activator NlpD
MFGLSVFLIVSAGSRFSGIAWGGLVDQDKDASDFLVMDLSDAAYAEQPSEARYASANSVGAGESRLKPPQELDAFVAFPDAEKMDLPFASAMASLRLPETIDEPTGPLGFLPTSLSDFESIVLNVTEDGLRLPDDLEDIPGMELLSDDIIFTEVGINWKEHVVKSGETLSDIAMRYGGLTIQDILRVNDLKDPNRLAEKQLLLIPNGPQYVDDTMEEVRTRKARVAALREQVRPLKVTSYTVVAGDSLWSIANTQNLEVDTLVGSNAFKDSSLLHPGSILRIPNQDGIFYQIKKGDTVEKVARRYQVALDRIRKVNPTVDLVSLKAGVEVFLPGARPEAIVDAQPKKPSPSNQKASRTYRWPLMGRISSGYGWRRHPITRRRDFHTGLDIKANTGVVIRSSREGQVIYAGWMGGYGKVVVVEHGSGQKTLYAHCSSILVREGSRVSVGQNIARVGSTGRTTGPHLHFEVRNGNNHINPLRYLK